MVLLGSVLLPLPTRAEFILIEENAWGMPIRASGGPTFKKDDLVVIEVGLWTDHSQLKDIVMTMVVPPELKAKNFQGSKIQQNIYSRRFAEMTPFTRWPSDQSTSIHYSGFALEDSSKWSKPLTVDVRFTRMYRIAETKECLEEKYQYHLQWPGSYYKKGYGWQGATMKKEYGRRLPPSACTSEICSGWSCR